MSNLLLITGTLWLAGAAVTWLRLGRISSDSPGVRFIIALISWPYLIWRVR